MHIALESSEKHAIQSYSDHSVRIAEKDYVQSVLVTHDTITLWQPSSIKDLTLETIQAILLFKPEVFLLGSSTPALFLPSHCIEALTNVQIGVESMSIGSACRTFNLLLGERRRVMLGLVLTSCQSLY